MAGTYDWLLWDKDNYAHFGGFRCCLLLAEEFAILWQIGCMNSFCSLPFTSARYWLAGEIEFLVRAFRTVSETGARDCVIDEDGAIPNAATRQRFSLFPPVSFCSPATAKH